MWLHKICGYSRDFDPRCVGMQKVDIHNLWVLKIVGNNNCGHLNLCVFKFCRYLKFVESNFVGTQIL